jgi:hypothetical protein
MSFKHQSSRGSYQPLYRKINQYQSRNTHVSKTYRAARPIAGTIQRGTVIGKPTRTAQWVSIPHRSKRFLQSPYLAARRKVLSLGKDALVVVDVVLPAVLGLVHVGETSISACASTRVSDMRLHLATGPPATGSNRAILKLRAGSSQSTVRQLIGLPKLVVRRSRRRGVLLDGLTSCKNAVSLGSLKIRPLF